MRTISQTLSFVLKDRRNRAAVIGVASGLALGVVVLTGVLVAGSRGEKGELGVGSPSASGLPVTGEPSAGASAVPDIPSEPLSALPVEPPFVIRANAEISGLKVGAETMAFLDGAKDIELGSRPSTGTVVEATSRDGRRAKGTVTSEAHELKLVFPPIKRGGGTPKPPSGGNTTPFADNPYKKK